jgi:hypothetical protein
MTNLTALKREVDLLHKALNVGADSQQQEQTTKLLFYYDKLIELSRNPNPEEQARLKREIDEFNAKHPLAPCDLLRIEPYKGLFEEASCGN